MSALAPPKPAFYPGRAPIDAYGNGGFRFADMSHKGSLLCLPSGIYGWEPEAFGAITLVHLAPVFAQGDALGFVLLGTGREQIFALPEMAQAFEDAGVGLEVMDTGAAARTYNLLLAEGRPVGAALIAVD